MVSANRLFARGVSVRGRKAAHGELNLTVRKLTPVLDDRHKSAWCGSIDDLTGLIAGRVERQRKSLGRGLCGGNTVCQPARANEHARPPRVSIRQVTSNHQSPLTNLKYGQWRSCDCPRKSPCYRSAKRPATNSIPLAPGPAWERKVRGRRALTRVELDRTLPPAWWYVSKAGNPYDPPDPFGIPDAIRVHKAGAACHCHFTGFWRCCGRDLSGQRRMGRIGRSLSRFDGRGVFASQRFRC